MKGSQISLNERGVVGRLVKALDSFRSEEFV